MDRIVNIGIIGCGGIAEGKHLPSLSKIENVRIVAFCDLIIEKAQEMAKQYGTPDAKVCTDYHELLADPSIEVVHVLTPNRAHADISIDALKAGKHVMCEKPMAKSGADAKRMYEAAVASGKKLSIGYQHRQKPQSIFAKKYIEEGKLGEIYYAKALATRRRGTPNWGVFLNEYEQGGGPVVDIATHSLDLTLYLMDNYEPRAVMGKTHKKLEDPEQGNFWGDNGVSTTPLEESACALIEMKNGATIILETSWALNISDPIEEGSCVLCGSKAGLSIINNELEINKIELGKRVETIVHPIDGGVAFYEAPTEDFCVTEARSWINSIVNDTDPVVMPYQAMVVSQILEAIYTSSKTGKTVYFE